MDCPKIHVVHTLHSGEREDLDSDVKDMILPLPSKIFNVQAITVCSVDLCVAAAVPADLDFAMIRLTNEENPRAYRRGDKYIEYTAMVSHRATFRELEDPCNHTMRLAKRKPAMDSIRIRLYDQNGDVMSYEGDFMITLVFECSNTQW